MQITSEVLSVLSAIISSIFTTGIAYGVMKTKIDRIENDLTKIVEHEKDCDERYVSHTLFNATISPIRDGLNEMRGDIKKILVCLNKNYIVSRRSDEMEE